MQESNLRRQVLESAMSRLLEKLSTLMDWMSLFDAVLIDVAFLYFVCLWVYGMLQIGRNLGEESGVTWRNLLGPAAAIFLIAVFVASLASTEDHQATRLNQLHRALNTVFVSYPPLLMGLFSGRKLYVPIARRSSTSVSS